MALQVKLNNAWSDVVTSDQILLPRKTLNYSRDLGRLIAAIAPLRADAESAVRHYRT